MESADFLLRLKGHDLKARAAMGLAAVWTDHDRLVIAVPVGRGWVFDLLLQRKEALDLAAAEAVGAPVNVELRRVRQTPDLPT